MDPTKASRLAQPDRPASKLSAAVDAIDARMRMLVIRLLKKYKYPPEGLDAAMETVLKQCGVWTDNAP